MIDNDSFSLLDLLPNFEGHEYDRKRTCDNSDYFVQVTAECSKRSSDSEKCVSVDHVICVLLV